MLLAPSEELFTEYNPITEIEDEGVTNGEERYTPIDAMSFEEMLSIAESLEPLE